MLTVGYCFYIGDQSRYDMRRAFKQPQGLRIPASRAGKDGFRITAGKRAPRGCRNPSPGSNRLHAAYPTAAAKRSVRVGQRVAQMPSQTAGTGKQPSVTHHAAANPGGDGNKRHVADLTSNSPVFSPGSRLRIVHRQRRQVR